MGFIFDPSVVPFHRIVTLFDVFGSLEQNVIVKLDVSKLPENETLNIPRNVLVLPFVPQVCIKYKKKYLNVLHLYIAVPE